jgi:nitroreductase
MDFNELIYKRYSVRSYRKDPVEDAKLQQILEAARMAPTAANRQAFQIIVVHTAGREKELGRIYHRPWFTSAPMIICACAVPSRAWVRGGDQFNAALIDVTIAMDHLILAAANLGLGTCWIAAFDVSAAREVIGLPSEVEPLIFTPLGYPADNPTPKTRKPLHELVHFEKWSTD